MTVPLLEMQTVTCRYPEAALAALHDVSLTLRPGEMLALAGASGAGKSTLCRCINRVIPTFQRAGLQGRILVSGESIAGKQVHDLVPRVGMVFQDFETQLFSTRVWLEVAFGLENLGTPCDEMVRQAREILAQVGLTGLEERDPVTLSGGQKQRLVIAAVFAMRPDLLLMDEPTTDLDPVGRAEVLQLTGQLRNAGTGIILVDHELDELVDADRIAILREGAVALDLPAREALQQPALLAHLGVRPAQVADAFARLGVQHPPVTVEEGIVYVRDARWQLHLPPAVHYHASGEPLLEVQHVSFAYPGGHTALRDVNLAIHPGEIVAILGSNGSGKTTLCKLLTGLLAPGEGEIRFRGSGMQGRALAHMARYVGYVFQNPDHQLFAASIREEVEFGPRNFGVPAEQLPERVAQALAAVHLTGQEVRNPFMMTRGERQRVAVASILSAAPEVLILDEPTTGLDYGQQREMMEMMLRLRQAGHTIIIVTHTMWLAAAYAERCVLMADGEVLLDGPTRRVFTDTELLARASLKPPAVTALGAAFNCPALTVEELLNCIER